MPETFVRLSQWLRAPVAAHAREDASEAPEPAIETAREDELHSGLRRLRAAVLEALESPSRDALERIRVHAEALLEGAS